MFALAAASLHAGEAPPAANGDLIPVLRVEPAYPRTAIVEGISGWVRLHFTVLPDGSVANVKVVGSSPAGVFDASAVRAVSKWRFKPRVIDGVAVAREAEQRLEFKLDYSGSGFPASPLARDAAADRADVVAHHDRIRALCPDRFPHADDKVNAALSLRLKSQDLRPALMTVEPERQADADAALVNDIEPCLFSSWEQLRSPEAYELEAWFLEKSWDPSMAGDSVAALRAVAAQKRDAKASAAPSPQQSLQVRSWLLKRFVPAYYELINAQAAQYPPAVPTTKQTADALDRAKAATERKQPKEARSILAKALKKTTEAVDRGLLLLALSRAQLASRDASDALASLDQALAIERLPWNLAQNAQLARATLCGRGGDAACFDDALTKLNDELGVADRLNF